MKSQNLQVLSLGRVVQERDGPVLEAHPHGLVADADDPFVAVRFDLW